MSQDRLNYLERVRRNTDHLIFKKLPYSVVDRMRRAHKEWIKDLYPTHWVTFNFRIEEMNIDDAEKKLNLWFWRMHEKLCGKKSFDLIPSKKKIRLFGYFEKDQKGMLHLHSPVNVPMEFHDRFAARADKQWKRILGRGDVFTEVVGKTDEDLERIAQYATKGNMAEHFWVCPV